VPEKRYYTLDDPEHGITREQFAELSDEEKREYMLAWFHAMFEDPANGTPYESSEGGYMYIWGGPYDAREQLGDEFSEIASEELIEEIIEEVESDGIVDWAPGRNHPDHIQAAQDWRDTMEDEPRFDDAISAVASGAVPEFGSDFEVKARAELASSANNVLSVLAGAEPEHGGMGHNRPPKDIGEYELPADIEDQIRSATLTIEAETKKGAPDVAAIASASDRLSKVKAWITDKADKAADEFAKGFGKAAGTTAGAAFVAAIIAAIGMLLGASWHWLTIVLPVLS
jgi:LmbE family N-acetylglucosaminyl deacetylase